MVSMLQHMRIAPRLVATARPSANRLIGGRCKSLPIACCPWPQVSLGPLMFSRRGYAATSETQPLVRLVITDPKRLFKSSYKPLSDEANDHVEVRLPQGLVQEIRSKGSLEETDDYNPINFHYFGERGEMFQYTYVGTHGSQSDATAIVDPEALSGPIMDDFGEFKSRELEGTRVRDPRHPLLFVGNLINAYGLDGAAVYLLRKNGETTGLLIQSVMADADD